MTIAGFLDAFVLSVEMIAGGFQLADVAMLVFCSDNCMLGARFNESWIPIKIITIKHEIGAIMLPPFLIAM
jgi:hypothetical protein